MVVLLRGTGSQRYDCTEQLTSFAYPIYPPYTTGALPTNPLRQLSRLERDKFNTLSLNYSPTECSVTCPV